MSECVTVRVSRTVEVGAGVFAPGHLGELTQVVPFELVDAVLEDAGAVQRRLRGLPSRVGVYLVLAMGLFADVGVEVVWSKLVAGLVGVPVVAPSEKALRDLRRRVGVAPVKALFGVLAGPLARASTPGVRYRRWRTVAFDGCSSLKAPDHERVRGWLGRHGSRLGPAGYPALRLMALVETGTRGLLGAVFGPSSVGERAWAADLLPLLRPDMLLLADQGFDGGGFAAKVAATGAQFLVRVRADRNLPVLAVLPDGSYLTRIAGVDLRVVQARVVVTGQDGSVVTGVYRLMTTLTCHRADPAVTLVRLYHERWEIESAFFALRHTLMRGRVLRSKDPVGLEQEMWALLTGYQALRTVMVDAAESLPGTDPDRCAFTVALAAAQDSIVLAQGIAPDAPVLVASIGTAVLARLLPARRPRYSARKVKCPTSRYHAHLDPDRPLTSTAITGIDIGICEPASTGATQTTPRPAAGHTNPTTPRGFLTNTTPLTPKPPRPPTLLKQATTILATAPHRAWKTREIARLLGITDPAKLNSFSTCMSAWSRQGLFTKTALATYTTPQRNQALTQPPNP